MPYWGVTRAAPSLFTLSQSQSPALPASACRPRLVLAPPPSSSSPSSSASTSLRPVPRVPTIIQRSAMSTTMATAPLYESFCRRRIGRASSPPTWACYEQIPYDDGYSESGSDDNSCSEDEEDYVRAAHAGSAAISGGKRRVLTLQSPRRAASMSARTSRTCVRSPLPSLVSLGPDTHPLSQSWRHRQRSRRRYLDDTASFGSLRYMSGEAVAAMISAGDPK